MVEKGAGCKSVGVGTTGNGEPCGLLRRLHCYQGMFSRTSETDVDEEEKAGTRQRPCPSETKLRTGMKSAYGVCECGVVVAGQKDNSVAVVVSEEECKL